MLISTLALAAVVALSDPSPADAPGRGACSAYHTLAAHIRQQADYDVYRNGKKIGRHSVTLRRSGGELVARISTDLKVKLLFVTVYRYSYRSEEAWCGDRLSHIRTVVDDNGRHHDIELDSGRIRALEARYGRLVTTNHWNAAALEASHLFNTITGKVNSVAVARLDLDRHTGIGTYDVSGDLDIHTRYDRNGNWRGMSFRHKDGSKIEFREHDREAAVDEAR